MMQEEFEQLIDFDLENRRQIIETNLLKSGIKTIRYPFKTVLAEGINIFVPPANSKSSNVALIVTHYDGSSLHDNAGGVWLAMQILQHYQRKGERDSFSVLFTDQEEIFQQGAVTFLYEQIKRKEFSFPYKHIICIDGFGAGNEITIREHSKPFSYKDFNFRMDADIFLEFGFNVCTIFSGLDCLRESTLQNNQAECLDDFDFQYDNLAKLNEKFIVHFDALIKGFYHKSNYKRNTAHNA